jgi:hypothetical protein
LGFSIYFRKAGIKAQKQERFFFFFHWAVTIPISPKLPKFEFKSCLLYLPPLPACLCLPCLNACYLGSDLLQVEWSAT